MYTKVLKVTGAVAVNIDKGKASAEGWFAHAGNSGCGRPTNTRAPGQPDQPALQRSFLAGSKSCAGNRGGPATDYAGARATKAAAHPREGGRHCGLVRPHYRWAVRGMPFQVLTASPFLGEAVQGSECGFKAAAAYPSWAAAQTCQRAAL
jgi:hypothetical protein